MARFDVHEYKGGKVPYVVEVQASLLADLVTAVVVPLVPFENKNSQSLAKLHPVVNLNGREFVFVATDLSSIRRRELGEVVANLEASHRQDLVDALDFLFQGF